nr:hypothetical protein E2R29_08000 [Burkholderia pseudomallei]
MTFVLRSRIDVPNAREWARHDYSRRSGRNMTDGGTHCGRRGARASNRRAPARARGAHGPCAGVTESG